MKILIGYDGSSYADAAIEDLRRSGLPNEVEALVVTVGDPPLVPPFANHQLIEKSLVGDRVVSIVDHAKRHVSEALMQENELVQSASSRLRSYFPYWKVQGNILVGTPASEIVRKAGQWQADLIVVGSQGRSAIGRLILGSVSVEVATAAGCSVRIGRQGYRQTDYRDLRIVVGLDSSPGAERAIRKVLLRPWPKGTELRIVAVDDGFSSIKPDLASILDMYVGEDISITTGPIIKLAEAKGLSISTRIKVGQPQRVLVAEAREWEADCIVIGSQETSNKLQGLFAQSISTGLAANAECSVEIVR